MKLFFLMLLLPLSVMAQELKVLPWNTFLIPPPWNTTKQKERAALMAEKLPTSVKTIALILGPCKVFLSAMVAGLIGGNGIHWSMMISSRSIPNGIFF
jgi:hypothetical protein